MSLFNRYGPCMGITLYSFKNKRAELWYIPSNYEIVEHLHPNEDDEIYLLLGKAFFMRRDIRDDKVVAITTNWRTWLRAFTIKHYHAHLFKTFRWPIILINFQTFLNNHKPVSAAVDFKEF